MAGERAHLIPLIPRPVTEPWLQRVRDQMDVDDISKRELARRVGATAGTIQQLLGPVPPKSCRFVDRICRELHIPPPGVDDEDAELWAAYRKRLLIEDLGFYRAVVRKIESRLGRRLRLVD